MKISFIISFIIILLALIIFFLFFKKKKSLRANIFIALNTGIIIMSFLVFPLLEYKNVFTRGFASFIYATKCARMGQDLSILSKINLDSTIGYLYFVFMNTLFLIMPLLTISFILAYVEKIFTYIKLALSKNKEFYIFSEINEKSVLLAKKLQNRKKSTILFISKNEKENLNIKAIVLNKKITDIKLKTENNITFYMVSINEEKNLNETLELIDKYKDRSNTKINIINNSNIAPIILDSTNKGKITVEIINEKERAIFNLLNNKPLYLNTINNTISILIVGCGNLGKEFLRNSVWCSMVLGFKLKILVVDIKANSIKENINIESPELLDNYDISFINADIKSREAIDLIKSRNDINYVLVSLDTDNKNIETAIRLRQLYLKEFDREPIINLWIENEYKQEQILRLTNEKQDKYNLNAFGSLEDLYNRNSIIDSELEKLAIQVHLSYNPNDKNLENYNLREYNKRSSRASALHIKYKLFSILKDKFTDDMKENQKRFKEMYSPEIVEILAKNEHERWVAYMRSIGYVCASIDKVEKYYKNCNHYIHYLAKMHPALVEYDELDRISKELSRITSKEINLKESDSKIIRNIYEKIDL